MSISHEYMWRNYELLTDHELQEVRELHPREAKLKLAEELVTRFYDIKAARIAKDEFEQRHGRKEFLAKEEIEVKDLTDLQAEEYWPLVEVLLGAHLVTSKSEARRLMQQGAVEVDGQKITGLNHQLRVGRSYEVRVGKRRFTKIHLRHCQTLILWRKAGISLGRVSNFMRMCLKKGWKKILTSLSQYV